MRAASLDAQGHLPGLSESRWYSGKPHAYWSENKAPAAQLNGAGAVRLSPSLTTATRPLAVLQSHPSAFADEDFSLDQGTHALL
jgi:hypothetical protein